MKKLFFFISFLFVFQNFSEAQQHPLIALEHQWIKAIENEDTAFLKNLLDKDFVDVTWNGHLRYKKDMIRHKSISGTTPHLSQLRERIYDHTGTVNGINTVYIPNMDRKVRIRFTDVFINENDEWHAVSAQESVIQ